uniref:PNPLA domain-containing protein n=1 Tax=Esox lucius TaxID=8010 RepID=A0A3P8ZTM6_ESOLU
MSLSWAPDRCVLRISRAVKVWQGRHSASFPLRHACQIHVRPSHSRKVGHLGWKSVQTPKSRSRGKQWLCRASQVRHRLGLHTGAGSYASSSRWSAGLSHTMSRFRSTLDSVSKAVSGTHAELLSKIARLRAQPKQKAIEAGRTVDTVPETGLTLPAAKTTTTAVSKQTAPLFHPGSLSANLDETYNYLAQHINSYFGATQHHGKKAENASNGAISTHRLPVSGKMTAVPAFAATPPSAQSSPKKGFGRYLSYSGDTVQAFVGSVGSYIAPLVPRFSRASAATGTPEVESEEATEKMDPKASEERAKRLQLQREKIIARVSVDNRTRALVKSLQRASEVRVYVNRVEELGYHLLEFPETRGVAVKEKVIPCLLRLRQAEDLSLKAAVREALTLVGYSNPVKGWGIRVLSIDGGGTRGLIALQTLQKLEALTGKPIHELFDYICGVSTGSILGFMLGLFQIPLNECEVLYRKLGSDVFKQNVIVGTVKMGWNHAFYDSETWENILKEKMGADLMVETSRNPNCPKVAAVSTIVNRGTPLKAYVFRNYNLQPGVRSHYLGGCEHQLWQAVRASSAAPGYFQEFALGNDLHQDGGLLINNPTALAIHECKCLWPDTPVQCVVSLGTGRVETAGKNNTTYTSLKTKLTNVISSATDTEEVHVMLDALLPPDTYFRFNPYMNEDIALDESRGEKLNLLQAEGLRYLDRNQEKLQKAARILAQGKSPAQRLADWAKLKADMYDGIPGFSSKL